MNHSGMGHQHAPAGANSRALRISAWLTGVYFLVELGIGLYTESIAVLSDALHTFSAVGGVVLAAVAGRIAGRAPDRRNTFGGKRAEIIGALFNGLFLLGMAVIVLGMGAKRLFTPIDLPTGPMLIAAVGGLITELISMALLYSGQKHSLNLRGAFWHLLQTFVGSLIIIVVAVVIQFTDFLIIDPLLGMLFGLVLVYASWGILRDSVRILMESTPSGVDLDRVRSTLAGVPGVEDVHHLHAWTLTSGQDVFSAHIRHRPEADRGRLLIVAREHLHRDFGFAFTTLQLEDRCLDESRERDFDITDSGGF